MLRMNFEEIHRESAFCGLNLGFFLEKFNFQGRVRVVQMILRLNLKNSLFLDFYLKKLKFNFLMSNKILGIHFDTVLKHV